MNKKPHLLTLKNLTRAGSSEQKRSASSIDSAIDSENFNNNRGIFSRTYESFLKHSARNYIHRQEIGERIQMLIRDEKGDVPGWVLVVLMTTGLVTAIWAIAAPRISSLLRNSLDSMNSVR